MTIGSSSFFFRPPNQRAQFPDTIHILATGLLRTQRRRAGSHTSSVGGTAGSVHRVRQDHRDCDCQYRPLSTAASDPADGVRLTACLTWLSINHLDYDDGTSWESTHNSTSQRRPAWFLIGGIKSRSYSLSMRSARSTICRPNAKRPACPSRPLPSATKNQRLSGRSAARLAESLLTLRADW